MEKEEVKNTDENGKVQIDFPKNRLFLENVIPLVMKVLIRLVNIVVATLAVMPWMIGCPFSGPATDFSALNRACIDWPVVFDVLVVLPSLDQTGHHLTFFQNLNNWITSSIFQFFQ